MNSNLANPSSIELSTFDRAAIERLQTPKEAAYIAKMAKVAGEFYRARDDRETSQQAKEIYLRSARRAGQLLLPERVERSNGGRPKNSLNLKRVLTKYMETLEEAGITPHQGQTWQRLAEIDDLIFEEYFLNPKFQLTEYTINGLLRFAANGGESDDETLDGAMDRFKRLVDYMLQKWPEDAPELIRVILESRI